MPEQQPQPAEQQKPLKVIDTKKFGITGLEKETLQNFLRIHAQNDFNLKAYLQQLGAFRLGIKDGTLVAFDLQLDQDRIEARFLAPDDSAPAAPPAIEAA